MSEAYKKFTAQDYAVIPANAHKQYKFNSQSANDNRVTWHSARWTSESVSQYSTSSGTYGGDTKNVVKYNQLDHLFYRNFKKSINDRLGYNNYLKQQRKLYQNVQILSIPAGLYGHEVKPGEFYISSSNYEIYDDTHGNLFVSGTKFEFYPSDIRKNVFKLEPVNAFKAYDLDTIPGYAVKLTDLQDKSVGITKRFWRRGVQHPDATAYYNTPDNLTETDDSYYFNDFKYKNVNFSQNKYLGPNLNNYSAIDFDSKVGSHIVSPHNEKFNFNDEDFSISFYIDPAPIGAKIINKSGSIGTKFAGGIIYHVDAQFIYIIATEPVGKLNNKLSANYDWGVLGANANAGVGNVETGQSNTPKIGDGEPQLVNMEQADGVGPNDNLGYLMRNKLSYNGYEDWYVPTLTEMYTADTNLKILGPDGVHNPEFENRLEEQISNDGVFNELLTSTEDNNDIDGFVSYVSGSNTVVNTHIKNISTTPGTPQTFFPVRKIPRGVNSTYYGERDDYSKRYIICKSGTQTVSPSDLNPGTQLIKNNTLSGSSQPLDIPSQPQYPFEIYMISQSLYFSRSDGKITTTIQSILTGSSNHPEQHHVLCQKTGSNMQIYIDGKKVAEGSDSQLEETRNLANLYIGSKGMLSKADGNKNAGNTRFYNGNLSCINIWNRSYNTASIINISESIDASPYVGNIFYQNGFATLTKPNIQDIDLPSISIKSYQIDANIIPSERALNYSYNNKPVFDDEAVKHDAIAVHEDGTRYYYIAPLQSTIKNTVDGYGGSGDKSLLHEHPTMIYQHNMSTPFSFYSESKDGDNTGTGAYLTGNDAHALTDSASYAVISSSLPYLWLTNITDMRFHPSGTYLYLSGRGYDILSGSQHPTLQQMEDHFTNVNPTSTNPPPNNLYTNLDAWLEVCWDNDESGLNQSVNCENAPFWYFEGLIQIPLATPWDISSGSVTTQANPAGTSSLRIDSATIHQTRYMKFDNQTEENDLNPTQKYKKMGGEDPRCFAFSTDGTKFFTAHEVSKIRWTNGVWRYSSYGPDLYPNPEGLPSGPNTGLDSTYNIIEHTLTTPWDITTIETTGHFHLNNSINFTTDPTLVPANDQTNNPLRYGHAGKVLDLSTLISPEGYPIKIRSIEFNKVGTRMFLTSRMSSLSEPEGTRFAAGGWGTQFDPVNGWIAQTNNGTSLQGTRLWEYELEVPFDILSAVYVNSTPLAQPGGVLERSWNVCDEEIKTDGFCTSVTYKDSEPGVSNLKFLPAINPTTGQIENGKAYYFTNSRARTITKIPITTPPKETPFKVHFQGSHLIFEHEYQCTIDEYEFNDTLNISARKIRTQDSHELADFATGSLFKPYITTVGLYDEDGELLVVGKLGQPLRASNETDTTIILRWDS